MSQRPDAALLIAPAVKAMAATLAEDEAMVGYWRYTRWELDSEKPWKYELAEPSLLAFVVLSSGETRRVELKPVEDIARAVSTWRDAVRAPESPNGEPANEAGDGTSPIEQAGQALRELVLDPVLAAVDDAERLIVSLDDVLHLVPLDALPLHGGLVGECYRIEVRTSLRELLWQTQQLAGDGELLALGGVDYERVENVDLDAVVARTEDGKTDEAVTTASSKSSPSRSSTVRGAAAPRRRCYALWARAASLPFPAAIGRSRTSRSCSVTTAFQ